MSDKPVASYSVTEDDERERECLLCDKLTDQREVFYRNGIELHLPICFHCHDGFAETVQPDMVLWFNFPWRCVYLLRKRNTEEVSGE